MTKSFVIFTLFLSSLAAHAGVQEIELSRCYKAKEPTLRMPGLDGTVTYGYQVVIESLVIVTDSYGRVVSERVYKKTLPEIATYDGNNPYITDEVLAQRALQRFRVKYLELQDNACSE